MRVKSLITMDIIPNRLVLRATNMSDPFKSNTITPNSSRNKNVENRKLELNNTRNFSPVYSEICQVSLYKHPIWDCMRPNR